MSLKYANQLASNHQTGNVLFSPIKDILLIPSNNLLSAIDLKTYTQCSLKTKTKFDISVQEISPCGKFLAIVDEFNKIYILSLAGTQAGSLLGSYQVTKKHGNAKITTLKFSNSGQLAVASSSILILYDIPVIRNPKNLTPNCIKLIRVYNEMKSHSEITCLSWSDDDSSLLVGNENGQSMIFSAIRTNKNLKSRLVLNRLAGNDRGKIVFGKILKDGRVLVVASNKMARIYERIFNYDDEEDQETEDQIKKNEVTNIKKENVTSTKFVPLSKIGNPDQSERNSSHNNADINQIITYNLIKKERLLTDTPVSDVTCCSFHESTGILSVGMKDGSFSLLDVPDFSVINWFGFRVCILGSVNQLNQEMSPSYEHTFEKGN